MGTAMNIEEYKKLPLEQLRDEYGNCLIKQKYREATVNTSRTDAFYIWRNGSRGLFWQAVEADDKTAENILLGILAKKSSVNPRRNISGYTLTGYSVTIETRMGLQQEVKDIFTTAASEVRGIGLEAADLLVEGCSQSEVEEKLAENVRKADAITEKCQQDAIQLIETRLTEMGQALDLIEDSEFTNQLKTRLSGKFNALPENIQKIIGGAGPGLQKAGQAVVDKAYKAGVQGGMKLSNFSGSAVHDIVLKAGHSVGFKFKPWQAVKITKGVAIGGRVLGVLGVGFSVFMQIKSDHDAEVLSAELKSNRQNIRSQFNTAANELESYGKTFIQNNVIHALEPSLSSVDSKYAFFRISLLYENRSLI